MHFPKAELSSVFMNGISRPVTIVGGGAVASEKIVPALIALSAPRSSILVLDLSDTASRGSLFREMGVVYEQCASNEDIVRRAVAAQSPTFIATWPDTHFAYASELLDTSIPVAVEKPLCANAEDLAGFEHLLLPQGANGMPLFCLGYYALEKALPLVCCFDADVAEKARMLLAVETSENRRQFESGYVRQQMLMMGSLRKLDIAILEGADRSPSGRDRHWTEQSHLGGVLFDTFVHVLQLAIIVVGEGPWLDHLEWADGWCGERLRELGVDAGDIPAHCTSAQYTGEVEISLAAGKFTSPDRCLRSAVLMYENGRISCDFDARRCKLEPHDAIPVEIAFRDDLHAIRHKYAAQMVQALNWLEKPYGRPPDARGSQLAALRTLLSRHPEKVRRFDY